MDIQTLLGNNVAPAFAAGLTRVEAYTRLLKRHDWHHERNDTCRWMESKTERRWLEKERPIVDPDFVLWNLHAPREFQAGAPV